MLPGIIACFCGLASGATTGCDAQPPSAPPPLAETAETRCHDDGNYFDIWACSSWVGFPCRSGASPRLTGPDRIARLVMSCPEACNDVTPICPGIAEWAAGIDWNARGAPGAASITHEVTSGAADSAPDLIKQTMRAIPREGTQLAHERRLPYAPAPGLTDASLSQEHDETRAFLDMQLSRDPRLQPDDITVDTDHMRQCTSCGHDAGLRNSLHSATRIDIGTRTQLLVDDWPVHSWTNAARFLEPPRDKHALELDEHGDARFGCPCSAFETADGQVQLYYQSGPSVFGAPDDSWEEVREHASAHLSPTTVPLTLTSPLTSHLSPLTAHAHPHIPPSPARTTVACTRTAPPLTASPRGALRVAQSPSTAIDTSERSRLRRAAVASRTACPRTMAAMAAGWATWPGMRVGAAAHASRPLPTAWSI